MAVAGGTWFGHEGDAIGWETLALHNPDTGATFVAATDTCGDGLDLFTLFANAYSS